MKLSTELTNWLCLSRTGASLHAQPPAGDGEGHCRLCDHPLGVMNADIPCLHWLISPYCKPERIKAVFENYPVEEVVRYVLIWTLAETKRHSARNLRCASRDGATDIQIGFRNRAWRFLLAGAGEATFEYHSSRTGFRFSLPLTLRDGEAETLQQLPGMKPSARELAMA